MPDMRETLRLLRGLQELDQDRYQVLDELRRLPKERSRREKKLVDARHRLSEAEQRLFEIRTRVKEIEDLTTSQRQRVRKLENEAADSRGDTALLVAFQHEIKSLKREISEAEEEGLGLVEESEARTSEVEVLKGEVGELEAEFEAYATNVEKEVTEAEARREELDKERTERLQGKVAPDVLVQYEKLLEAREGQAMALLDGRVCQGCYVSVPNNIYVRLARGSELVPCPSCGRILYLADL